MSSCKQSCTPTVTPGSSVSIEYAGLLSTVPCDMHATMIFRHHMQSGQAVAHARTDVSPHNSNWTGNTPTAASQGAHSRQGVGLAMTTRNLRTFATMGMMLTLLDHRKQPKELRKQTWQQCVICFQSSMLQKAKVNALKYNNKKGSSCACCMLVHIRKIQYSPYTSKTFKPDVPCTNHIQQSQPKNTPMYAIIMNPRENPCIIRHYAP